MKEDKNVGPKLRTYQDFSGIQLDVCGFRVV